MIKEHDQQAKMKATPRKLAYVDFDKEALVGSLAKGFFDRFSLESSGTSNTHRKTRSTIKSQKTLAKNKEPMDLRRSRRLEDQITTREKAKRERSKSKRKRSGHQGKSSDFEYEEGSNDACEDLNSPYKGPKPTPFTQRITHFKYHKMEKFPETSGFEELSQKFLEEFSQQKRYANDTTEIHGIKGRQNEGLQAFTDRFKSESSHKKGVPLVLHNFAFMHGHGHLELGKKLNDKIPKTVDEMFERVRAFIRGEVSTRGHKRSRNKGGRKEARRNMGVYTPYLRKDAFTSLTKALKEILAMESISFLKPPPLIRTLEKQNLNKFYDYHGDRVKDIRQNNQRNGNPGRNGVKVINMIRQEGNHKRSFKERRSGRTEMRSLGAVGSTIYSMIKFPNNQGVVTMETSREALQECKHLERVQGPWKEGQENAKEAFTISHEHPDQYVTIGTTLITNYKQLLAVVLRENKEEGLIRKVQYPEWIANTIVIKLANKTCKVQIDYSSLNKVCAKDMYPLPEEGEELASLMGYPYKCFLRLLKGYSQIRMVDGFHTEEGVYCFTHMPKELKNSVATLRRMMEKVLANQRGRNVETCLKEIVIKSKSKMDLVQDVKQTLRKLKRVNIKIDLTMYSFRVKEGKFFSHMVTKEGLRADPRRIHAIILSPTPRIPNQIQSLFLQLTTISKFISKLTELKHPIREARTRIKTAKEFGWRNETEEAIRRIKRKQSRLQTLAIPKEGEDLMLCLQQRNETISSVLLVEREGIQIHVSYVSRPLQRMEICYTPIEKRVQALIQTTRSLRIVFRKHKVKVVTDGSMKETLKLARREGRLGKWTNEICTYDISYIQRKEAEGPIVKKFFGQRSKKTIKEGSGVGIILISLEEKMYSYAIRLKFKASNHAMDYEALLAGLATSTNRGMKDLHVFIDSLRLVTQVEGNHTPITEQKKAQRGNYGCNGLIPHVLNHTSPKNLEPKSKSVDRAGKNKARIPQPGSIGRYQNKTIGRRDTQQ
uniref:Reverse transcriptase/retrotransposon-derived protein RNase H-like domain-containing protein n=1 Tax=Tanacetum cinerariifolium TaxID=118510 RepID=A0A699GKD9_TANCI|nr:hypothetical protein [Tanacetum cinerariifolium]